MADLTSTLTELGFALDTSEQALMQALPGLDKGGKYTVETCYGKGNVKVHVEQNNATEDIGGLSAVVSHPAVAVIESPKGRVAFNPSDLELAKALVTDLS